MTRICEKTPANEVLFFNRFPTTYALCPHSKNHDGTYEDELDQDVPYLFSFCSNYVLRKVSTHEKKFAQNLVKHSKLV